MFSKLREMRGSEAGAIVSVYILAAALLFVTAIGAGFTLGKYGQAVMQLNRCTSMVAKGTMIYMQRQAPPNKGVLTPRAIQEGTFIFNEGLCNAALEYNPLMNATATIDFQMVGSDTLVVTIKQRAKSFFFNAFPWEATSVDAAYVYQYGGASKNPVYDGTLF
jgi:hypothetical protein